MLGVLFGNSVKWGRMSVKSRSDMMVKTNTIWFPHRGVELTPNPSKRDLCRITQEHRVPQKAQGRGLSQPKSSNLIYKRKSGNVFLPGSTFVYQRRVTLSHCLSVRCTAATPTSKTSERKKEKRGREKKREKERDGRGSREWVGLIQPTLLTSYGP